MKELRLVVLGPGRSGFTRKFLEPDYLLPYDPTIDDSDAKCVTIDGEPYRVCVLDNYSEQFTALTDLYIKAGHGFLLVYSITSQSSLETLPKLKDRIAYIRDIDVLPPIIVVGNHLDREEDRMVDKRDGQALARELECGFMEVSMTRSGAEMAFQTLARMAIKDLEHQRMIQMEDGIGRLFALVVYLTDGYLRFKSKQLSSLFSPKEKKKEKRRDRTRRFLQIAVQLPMDLQMVLCHRVNGSGGNVVKTMHSEPWFQYFASLWKKKQEERRMKE